MSAESDTPKRMGCFYRTIYTIRTVWGMGFVVIGVLFTFFALVLHPSGFTLFDGFYEAAGFILGACLFSDGFKKFRELRLVEDTPVEAVNGLSMGRVHISGKVTAEKCLTSLFTNTPCVYYRAMVEHVEQGRKTKVWTVTHDDCYYTDFYIDDGTGRVKVDPKDWEIEATKTLFVEFQYERIERSYIDPSLGISAPLKELSDKYVFDSEGFRFTEHCLIAGRQANVIGECVENPEPKDENDRNSIAKGVNDSKFLVTSKNVRDEQRSLRRSVQLRLAGGAGLMILSCAMALGAMGLFKSPPPPPQMVGTVKLLANTYKDGAEAISTPEPVYPAAAKEKGIQGKVAMLAVVATDGTVKDARVAEVSGSDDPSWNKEPLLVKAVLEVLPQWRYKPTYVRGKPEEVEIPIEVEFDLQPAK